MTRTKYLRNGMRSYLMTDVPQVLHIPVIRVLVAYIKGTSYRTTVGIFSIVCEDLCNNIHKL